MIIYFRDLYITCISNLYIDNILVIIKKMVFIYIGSFFSTSLLKYNMNWQAFDSVKYSLSFNTINIVI